MAHPQQVEFCESVKQSLPTFFSNRLVVDIGSLDINGNNQYLFDDCQYLGIDLLLGRNVDIATTGHKLALPDGSIDVIVSTECFEHDQFYQLTLQNIVRMLKPGGLFLFSCATTGRPEHGTRRTSPHDAPFTQAFGEWADYYKNLEERDVRQVLEIDSIFEKYAFSIGEQTHDLYFWGVKRGILDSRQDYSFQIQHASVRAELKAREIFSLGLMQTLTNRDLALTNANQIIAGCNAQSAGRDELLLERDDQIVALTRNVEGCHARIDVLDKSVLQRDEIIAQLELVDAKQRVHIAHLEQCATDANITLEQTIQDQVAQIVRLNEIIADRDIILEQTIQDRAAQIVRLDEIIAGCNVQIDDLNNNVAELAAKVLQLTTSRSWRVTKPLRFTGRMLRGEFQTAMEPLTRSAAITLLHTRNALGYVARGDLKGLLERFKERQKESVIASIQTLSVKLREETVWCIMTTSHTLFVAHIIAERLRTHGWKVDIATKAPDGFPHDWYIVICPQIFDMLPPGEKRIAFQMEQSVSSRWFTDSYIKVLENSLAVLDYALVNLDFMAVKGIAYPHVHYLPVGASQTYGNPLELPNKTIDVLFYGDCNSSPRRREMLDVLRQHFNVRVASEVFGAEMLELIKQARLVINLHYYENALLETPRIQECLSLGVPVVSEFAQDQDDYPELAGAVHFFEQGSIPGMLAAVKSTLGNGVSIKKIGYSVERSAERFEFMFDRFLVAMGFLPAQHVTEMRLNLPLKNSRVALSLPETIARRRIFETDRPQDCIIFDGIRIRPGWVGCGLSYKALAINALRQGISRLIVMEDDVILPAAFEENMSIIHEFLDARPGKWDVFAGVIAALHSEVKVVSVEVFKDITFVEIDKMTSTVFNIYSEKTLKLLAAWDPTNLDAESNTIDRYLERQANLRVIVALPFFVGHREEVHSTLWGFQNTQYSEMIANSELALQKMIVGRSVGTM